MLSANTRRSLRDAAFIIDIFLSTKCPDGTCLLSVAPSGRLVGSTQRRFFSVPLGTLGAYALLNKQTPLTPNINNTIFDFYFSMTISGQCNLIFEQVVNDFHQHNDIDWAFTNPFAAGTLENLLYAKCWIDTAQWHMEDEIRNPAIEPMEAVKWKRRIDKSNQDRTDIVERIDDYFFAKYQSVQTKKSARVNTESPAGAIDRLSILILKIYHMREETTRVNVSRAQVEKNKLKLNILLQQQTDLSLAIDELLADIESGDKYMKVYRQMKMYNDPELNPVLYNQK